MDVQKISIIIPLFAASERFFADLVHFSNLDYSDYEILIVCDRRINVDMKNAKLILTNQYQTGPAEKRDIAIKQATGKLCAFIDDDAYPDKNWLREAVKHFEDPQVGAVAGPGLTPFEDNIFQKAGGAVYESIFGSGKYRYRFISDKLREVDDYPAYNLIIRKTLLEEIGGFNSTFYGGEDTKVCLCIIRACKKIIYDPNVIVYHHRRSLFIDHLKQIKNIGIHRGYFVKAFPETSLKLPYFLPSIISIFFVLGLILSTIFRQIRFFFLLGLLVGFVTVFLSTLRKNMIISFLASFGVIATHVTYGFAFIKGIMTKKLTR